MKSKVISLLLIFNLLLIFSSCEWFKEPEKEKTANEYIYKIFKEWYLWYDQIPELDPNSYDNYDDLVAAMKTSVDRWSLAGSLTKIKELLEKGEYKGFGAGFLIDFDKQIKISHCFTGSPLGLQGVQRGWIVKSVNGYTVDNVDGINEALNSDGVVQFVFADLEGKTITINTSRTTFQMNTVMYSNVYVYDEKKTGYLVFHSFVEASLDELKPVFESFSAQGVSDLIVDLRYNGGGMNSVAEALVGMIGGNKVKGKAIDGLVHNDKKTSMNKVSVSNYNGAAVNIDRVYFITSHNTASASEMVINCLKPYLDVKLVGAKTTGKPVGMYIKEIEELDLAVLPISFKNVNALGEGDYFEGFSPNLPQYDDITRNWGDPDELMLQTALNDIRGLSIAGTKSANISKSTEIKPLGEFKGINRIINSY